MDDTSIIKTKKRLKEMCNEMDELLDTKKAKRQSFQRLVSNASRLTKETVEKYNEECKSWGRKPELNQYINDLEGVYLRLAVLHQKVGNYSDAITTGGIFLTYPNNLQKEIARWYKRLPDDLLKLKALDSFIDSFLEKGVRYDPKFQHPTIRIVSEALCNQRSLGEGRLFIDNLRRQLNACLAIMTFADDEETRKLYLQLYTVLEEKAYRDRTWDTEEDANKYGFIYDITKDEAAMAKYKRHAEIFKKK